MSYSTNARRLIGAASHAALIALVAGLGGCGDSAANDDAANGAGGKNADGLWCDAKVVFDEHCVTCHDGEGTAGAPMGLMRHADFVAGAPSDADTKVWESVEVRVDSEAASAAGLPIMPPQGNLSEDELAAIDAWIAAGAPKGDCSKLDGADADGGMPTAPQEAPWPPEECDEIYTILASDGDGGPYEVPVGETHPQIFVDAPWGDRDVQLIAFRPITDNSKVLHHWIMYGNEDDGGGSFLSLEGFGGGPFLAGWAPGDDNPAPMPKNVGMEMPKGPESLRLDMHYYNLAEGAKAEKDASGLEICIVEGDNLRRNSSAVFENFSNIINLRVPANSGDYEVTGDCRVVADEPVHLMTASPHAHRYARHMKFSVLKKDGTEIVMHDEPFQFGEQTSYSLPKEVVIETGDVVTTTCTYDNDTNSTVTFGENTDDEMCFNFAAYYPSGALRCSLF